MILKTIGGTVVLFMLMLMPAAAMAADPMATIKGPIDAVIAILNDPQYKVPGTEVEQRDKIWKTVKPMFDFHEISRRAVARNWRDFTDAEKQQFVDVFTHFLGNTYIDKIQGEYHNEKIVYVGQELYQQQYAEVRTQILRETVEIPVYYRLIKEDDGDWRVYDIIVEGTSLVRNYRTQFASILQKESPSQLIQRLKEKLAEQNKRLTENG